MNIRRILFILGILTLASLTGCNFAADALIGSGNIVTQEYDFADFDEVDLSYAFVGTITRGESYSVVVRVDDNVVDKLVVEQDGSRVRIGLQENSIVNRATLEADITMPSLTWLDVSGASEAQLVGFSSTDDFTGGASGASRIHGDVTAGNLALDASGASTISLAGSGGNVHADASGASTIDLEEWSGVDADVVASGASTVTVNASGRLDAEASGASNVHYLGDPTLGDIEANGGGEVTPR